jgi:hypothetical protein
MCTSGLSCRCHLVCQLLLCCSDTCALCCRPCTADVEWNERYLLRAEGGYVPRFKMETAVLRVPVVPGSDPRIAYGDLVERGGYKKQSRGPEPSEAGSR